MCVETMKKMHRRGIRICIGGDYGFAWTPQGTNAKDLEIFRRAARHVADGGDPGRPPNTAARSWAWATSSARSRKGYLADLLLVDGDPIANIRMLQEKDRLLAIMKDGKFHKRPQMQEQRRRLTAVRGKGPMGGRSVGPVQHRALSP